MEHFIMKKLNQEKAIIKGDNKGRGLAGYYLFFCKED